MHQPEQHSGYYQSAPWRPQHYGKPLLQQHAKEEFLDNSSFNRQPDKAEGRRDDQHADWQMGSANVAQAAAEERLHKDGGRRHPQRRAESAPSQRRRDEFCDLVVPQCRYDRGGQGYKGQDLHAQQHNRMQWFSPNARHATESRYEHPCDRHQIGHQNHSFDPRARAQYWAMLKRDAWPPWRTQGI